MLETTLAGGGALQGILGASMGRCVAEVSVSMADTFSTRTEALASVRGFESFQIVATWSLVASRSPQQPQFAGSPS